MSNMGRSSSGFLHIYKSKGRNKRPGKRAAAPPPPPPPTDSSASTAADSHPTPLSDTSPPPRPDHSPPARTPPLGPLSPSGSAPGGVFSESDVESDISFVDNAARNAGRPYDADLGLSHVYEDVLSPTDAEQDEDDAGTLSEVPDVSEFVGDVADDDAPVTMTLADMKNAATWACQSCTLENEAHVEVCGLCGAARYDNDVVPPPPNPPPPDLLPPQHATPPSSAAVKKPHTNGNVVEQKKGHKLSQKIKRRSPVKPKKKGATKPKKTSESKLTAATTTTTTAGAHQKEEVSSISEALKHLFVDPATEESTSSFSRLSGGSDMSAKYLSAPTRSLNKHKHKALDPHGYDTVRCVPPRLRDAHSLMLLLEEVEVRVMRLKKGANGQKSSTETVAGVLSVDAAETLESFREKLSNWPAGVRQQNLKVFPRYFQFVTVDWSPVTFEKEMDHPFENVVFFSDTGYEAVVRVVDIDKRRRVGR